MGCAWMTMYKANVAKLNRSIYPSVLGRTKSTLQEAKKIVIIMGYATRSIGLIRAALTSTHHRKAIVPLPHSKSSFSRRNLRVWRNGGRLPSELTAFDIGLRVLSACLPEFPA